jgi:uncharacterized membrane protein
MRAGGILTAILIVAPILIVLPMSVEAQTDGYREIARVMEEEEAMRARVRNVLAIPDVEELARDLGVDIAWIAGGVDLLEGEELERADQVASEIQDHLAGGQDFISIRTTTLILILLGIIIVILV